jgi:hypothetical protein
LQALKAAQPRSLAPSAISRLSDNARRALLQFDREGRLVRWPTKFSVQRLAMWLLWTRFEGKRVYNEREVNDVLKAANAFGDHATLRRELANHRLLTRKSGCSEYRKVAARPDDDVKPLVCRGDPLLEGRNSRVTVDLPDSRHPHMASAVHLQRIPHQWVADAWGRGRAADVRSLRSRLPGMLVARGNDDRRFTLWEQQASGIRFFS